MHPLDAVLLISSSGSVGAQFGGAVCESNLIAPHERLHTFHQCNAPSRRGPVHVAYVHILDVQEIECKLPFRRVEEGFDAPGAHVLMPIMFMRIQTRVVRGYWGQNAPLMHLAGGRYSEKTGYQYISISYNVNMTKSPSRDGQSSAQTSSSSGSKQRTRSQSKPRSHAKPPNEAAMIAEIWEMCTKTTSDVSNIRETVGTISTEMTEVKTKIGKLELRHDNLEQETQRLDKKVKAVEESRAEMEASVEARIWKKIQDSGMLLSKPVSSVSSPVAKVPFPALKGSRGEKIHAAFNELLRAAETKKGTFLVGVVEKITESGAKICPKMKYQAFVGRFFHNVRYEIGPLGTAQSTGMPLGRVQVHPSDIHTMKIRIRDQWRLAKDLGWWVGQETPMDLREMQVNAFRFIMDSKTHCAELRRFYLEAEEGFIRFAKIPFLPVYLVPSDKEKWPELAAILLTMVLSVRTSDWMQRFKGVKKLNRALLDKWNEVLGKKNGPRRLEHFGTGVRRSESGPGAENEQYNDAEEGEAEEDKDESSEGSEEDEDEISGVVGAVGGSDSVLKGAMLDGRLYHLGGTPRFPMSQVEKPLVGNTLQQHQESDNGDVIMN